MKNNNILTPEQEQMRLQVVDLELKARYWKAQYDIRHYTLESEKLQESYDTFLTTSRDTMMKAIEEARKSGNIPPEVVQEVTQEVTNG